MNQNAKIGAAIGAASIVSATIGATVGFFIAKKRLKKQHSEEMSAEIAKAKEFYFGKSKPFRTPAEAVDALIPVAEAAEALLAYQGQEVKVEYADGTTETIISLPDGGVIGADLQDHNIFEDDNPEENPDDWEILVSGRSTATVYILTKEEFLQAEAGYAQVTLTYYEGDEVLADERDQPIEDLFVTIGENNLRFGYRSDDKNIVYLRNERLGLDFEIVKSEGTYREEVLGFTKDSPG